MVIFFHELFGKMTDTKRTIMTDNMEVMIQYKKIIRMNDNMNSYKVGPARAEWNA